MKSRIAFPRIALAVALAAALASLTPARPALADPGDALLASLSGIWKGVGTIREGADRAAERIRCRTTGTLERNGTILKNSGQCAGTQAKVNVAGTLSYSPETGLLTGNLLATSSRDGTTSSRGRATDRGARLSTVTTDARGTVVARGAVTITLSGVNRYTLQVDVTEATSGKRYRAADLTFIRR